MGFSSSSIAPEIHESPYIPDITNTSSQASTLGVYEEKEQKVTVPRRSDENSISIEDENNNHEESSRSSCLCSISIITNGTKMYEEDHFNGNHTELEIKEEIEGVVDIFHEEKELGDTPLSGQSQITTKNSINIGAIESLNFSNIGSFKSCSRLELGKKRSNTLKFINYKSNRL